MRRGRASVLCASDLGGVCWPHPCAPWGGLPTPALWGSSCLLGFFLHASPSFHAGLVP